MTVLRRAGLRLVQDDKGVTSDKKNYARLDNVMKKCHDNGELQAKSHDLLDILRQPCENNPNKINNLPKTDTASKKRHGPSIAPSTSTTMARNKASSSSDSTTPVDVISNAGVLEIPDNNEIPNEYEFEIFRLRRRVEEL